MGWDVFRRNVLQVMVRGPKDPNDIARAIARSYNRIVRTPESIKIETPNGTLVKFSGSKLNKHFVKKGNKDALERWVALQFYQQSFSLVPLPPSLPTRIAQGFKQYWLGARLNDGFPPSLVPFGSIQNMVVTNPGIVPPIPYRPAKSPEEFVENIIKLGKMHLRTISGNMTVNVVTPTGIVPTPVPWFMYDVIDERETAGVVNIVKKTQSALPVGISNILSPSTFPPLPSPPPPTPTPSVTVAPYVSSVTSTCIFVSFKTNFTTFTFTITGTSLTGIGFNGSGGSGGTVDGYSATCGLTPGATYQTTVKIYDGSVMIGEYTITTTLPLA